jgi:hypothetical protein
MYVGAGLSFTDSDCGGFNTICSLFVNIGVRITCRQLSCYVFVFVDDKA